MGEGKPPAGQTREHRDADIRDERELPTITVLRAHIDLIAASFDGRALPIARSIYYALVELATKPGMVITRKTLAENAGVSTRALAEYGPQLEAIGLAVIERPVDAKGGSLPTLWRLTEPGGWIPPQGAQPPPPPSSSSGSASSGDEDQPGGSSFHPLPDDVEADVLALLRAKRRVDGRLVSEDEMRKAAAALVAFNRCQGGADHGLGAHLPKLVGRIRERPNWTVDKLVRLVESAWRLKWWENSGRGRRPTPAVVFGNANVFEQVALDAAAEAAGQSIADTPERRGRYSRTVEPE